MRNSNKVAAELAALQHLPDEKIDISDIPERSDWSGAVRGRFNRGTQTKPLSRSLKRMSDRQKDQIRKRLIQRMDRQAIAAEVGVTAGQISAIKAWMTIRATTVSGQEISNPEGDEIIEAVETTFGLERDLQGELRKNIKQLDPDLLIVDGDRERSVKSGGRIDILAKDRSGALVVIELKAGRADRDAIGQLLAYMGELMEEASSVRGILIAADFSPRAIAAARAAPNIRLERYGIQFSFRSIPVRAGRQQ
jgi:hypothetical protein